MNLLERINIKAEVYTEYAFLSYTLFLCGSNEPVSADYTFVLPENAQISAMKVFYKDKLLSAKVCSTAHASKTADGGEAVATLRSVGKGEYLLRIGSVGEMPIKIMFAAYTSVSCGRLTIPLAKKNGLGGVATHIAKIDLNIRGGEGCEAFSPTHELVKTGEASYTTGDIAADTDFSAEVKNRSGENSAVVVRDTIGGEMLCRLYPRDLSFEPAKKLLVIYDTSGKIPKASSPTARDFVYNLARDFDGEFALTTLDNISECEFAKIDDDVLEKLLAILSRDDLFAEEVIDKRVGCAKTDADTEVLLVTGEHVSAELPSIGLDVSKRMHIVTFGDVRPPFGTHIYDGEDIRARAFEICKAVTRQRFLKNISASAIGSEVYVISEPYDDGITLYLRYSGKVPEYIDICCGERRVSERLSNIKMYDSFAPIGLVCAKVLSERLEEELKVCVPEKIPSIVQALESVGIKYSALNSETTLTVPLGTRNAEFKTVIPSSARAVSPMAGHSMFKESDGAVISERFVHECINYIIGCVKSDYAICGDYVLNNLKRAEETYICGLVLAACGKLDEYQNLAAGIEEYLSDTKQYGDGFKFDTDKALDKLGEVFPNVSENMYTAEDIMPDLMSAAKVVYMHERRQQLCL